MTSTNIRILSFVLLAATLFWSCSRPNSQASLTDRNATIYPDYTDVVVPPNIAPLNFRIDDEGSRFVVDFIGENGYAFSLSTSKNAIIPIKKWRKLLSENVGKSYRIQIYRKQNGSWEKFPAITNTVSVDPIDPYLIYRLIHPGYETAGYLRMQQRHLESFDCFEIINNSVAEESCMNCHIPNWGNPDQFVIHFRFRNSGTIVYKDGVYRRFNTVTPEFINPGIHPAWHPSGRFIAFSTNTSELYFHSNVFKRSESYDSKGNIAILDLETNTLLACPKLFTPDPIQETFPCWSPDGKYLYFCRFEPLPGFDTLKDIDEKLTQIKYDLLRIPFDEKTISFGEIEMVVDAQKMNKSTTLPRLSPDGRYLMFCGADQGTFTVWKKESDLYLLDLQTSEIKPLTAANSDDSDSYHSWSSNSKWFVVSSKRRNGFVALPYFSHIDSNGNASKAFLLPQKNPNFYETWIKSFNIPELTKGKTQTNIYDFGKAVKGPIINVNFGWTGDTIVK
jgi:hypothetical protein